MKNEMDDTVTDVKELKLKKANALKKKASPKNKSSAKASSKETKVTKKASEAKAAKRAGKSPIKQKPTPHEVNKMTIRKQPDARAIEQDIDREERVAVAAYYIAQKRGFDHLATLQNWIEAEIEIESRG